MLRDVYRDPVVPVYWGAAQQGMQAYSQVSALRIWVCRRLWLTLRLFVIAVAWAMLKLGLHKQIPNRLLEPWMWITVVLSGTTSSFANLFALRCHEKAEPHIQILAGLIRECMSANQAAGRVSQLHIGDWHLPFIDKVEDWDIDYIDLPKVSAARCARVSYLTHNGSRAPAKDLDLYDRLVADTPKHASALEHAAKCINVDCTTLEGYKAAAAASGNFEHGWQQLRKLISNEATDRPVTDELWA